MKKRNSLNYEIVKAIFDPNAEGERGGSAFRVNGGAEPILVDVPTSIMHRLFRLGQAQGIRQLRYFENETTVVVGSTEMRDFLSDLKRLRALVNDEVLHVYIDQLTVAIEAPPGTGSKHIAVRTGRYFERRS